MPDDQVEILIRAVADVSKAQSQIETLTSRIAALNKVSAANALTTGKLLGGPQQIMMLKSLGAAGSEAAGKLAQLRQQGSLFAQVFSGQSKQNIAALFATKAAFVQTSTRIRSELGSIATVVDAKTNPALGRLTSVDKFKIMGNVFSNEADRIANKMITIGKQAQWVGRQMIVGLSIPIGLAFDYAFKTFIRFNQQLTELRKYELAATDSTKQLNERMTQLTPSIAKLSLETGNYVDVTAQLMSIWAGIGQTSTGVNTALAKNLVPLTRLTEQVSLLSGGELDLAGSTELVRSIQASWGLKTEDTVKEIHKLVVIASETTIRLDELAKAIPLVSSSARLMGLDVAGVAGALTAMRNQGVSAVTAANTLKFSINRLVNPTQKAIDTFDALGHKIRDGRTLEEILFTPGGVGRGVSAIKDLAEVFQKLNDQQKLLIAGQLFGGYRADRMIKLFNDVTSSTGQFNKALESTNDEQKAFLTYQQQLQTVTKSSAFQWQKIRVELSLFAAKIGADIAPLIEKLAQSVINLLNKFEQAPEATKKFVLGLAAVLALLGPITYISAQLNLSLGRLFDIFLAKPLRRMFAISAVEDPFGLSALAKRTSNVEIQALAGFPKLNEAIATTTAEVQASRDLLITGLETETLKVDQLTLAYFRAEAARAASVAPIPGVATATSYGALSSVIGAPGISGVARTAALDEYVANQKVSLATLLSTGGLKASVVPYGANMTAAQLAMLEERKRLVSAGLPVGGLFPIPTGIGGKEITPSAEKLLFNVPGRGLISHDLVSKLTGLPKEELAKEVKTIQANLAEGVVPSAEAIRTAEQPKHAGIIATLRSLFTSYQKEVIGPSSQGAGFSTYKMGFSGLLGIAPLAITGGLLAAANSKSILAGLKGPGTEGVDTLKSTFTDIVKQIQGVLTESGKVKNTSQAWKAVGAAIGNIFLTLTKLVKFIATNIIPMFTGLARGIQHAFQILITPVKTIVDLFHGDLKGAIKDVKNIFNGINTVGQVLLTTIGGLVVGFAGFKIFKTIISLGSQLKNTFVAVSEAMGKSGTSSLTFSQQLDQMKKTAVAAGQAVTAASVKYETSVAAENLAISEKNRLQAAGAVGTQAYTEAELRATAATEARAEAELELAAAQRTEQSVAAAGMLTNPWAALGIAILGVISLIGVFHSKTNQAAEDLANNIGTLSDAFDKLADSIKRVNAADPLSKKRISDTQQGFLDLEEAVHNYSTNSIKNFHNEATAFNTVSTSIIRRNADIQNSLFSVSKDNGSYGLSVLQKNAQRLEREYGITARQLENIKNANVDWNEILQERIALQKNNSDIQLRIGDVIKNVDRQELASLTKQAMTQQQIVLGKLAVAKTDQIIYQTEHGGQRDPYYTEQIKALNEEVNLNHQIIRELESQNAWEIANKNTLLERAAAYQNLANKIKSQLEAISGPSKNKLDDLFKKDLPDALKDLISQLSGEVSNAFDTFENNRLKQFDRMAAAQENSIQKQIDAIQKQNDKEQWLQQQEQYRQQKQQMLDDQALSAAESYRERLKAIHEGNFDDARLIALQALQNQQQANQQIKDLNKQHVTDVKDHNRQMRTDALQKQLDDLQKSLAKRRDILQRHLDEEKQQLENWLAEWQKFPPQNKKQLDKMIAELGPLLDQYGLNINDINAQILKDWGSKLGNINGLVIQATQDARRQAYIDAKGVGTAAQQGFLDGTKIKTMTADLKLYDVLSAFFKAEAGTKGGLSPAQMSGWLTKIRDAMAGASSGAVAAGTAQTGSAPTGSPAAQHHGQIIFHKGGRIGGRKGHDVPMIGQAGEYVMKSRTVDRVGAMRMDHINKTGKIPKYHEGGVVYDYFHQDAISQGLRPLPAVGSAYSLSGLLSGGIASGIAAQIGLAAGAAAINFLAGGGRGGPGGRKGGGPVPAGSGPFYVFPVQKPYSYGDGFGAPRYAGGYHPHAGNDILAPLGNLVYAPFPGTVSKDPNTLGGNAIIEKGSLGYTYGAHLSRYGKTGVVKTGDVIGYVGNTGDAQGGPTHLHFEWHPNVMPSHPYKSIYGYTSIGSAIDPYPFLKAVEAAAASTPKNPKAPTYPGSGNYTVPQLVQLALHAGFGRDAHRYFTGNLSLPNSSQIRATSNRVLSAPAAVMAAIAMRESGGDPRAGEGSGHVGILQESSGFGSVAQRLNPVTAFKLARQHVSGWNGMTDWSPQNSFLFGDPTPFFLNSAALANLPAANQAVGLGKAPALGMAHGGMIAEKIWGIGRSGRKYTFGERGPEFVVPNAGQMGVHFGTKSPFTGGGSHSSGGGGGDLNIHMNFGTFIADDQSMRKLAGELERVGMKINRERGMGSAQTKFIIEGSGATRHNGVFNYST